MDLRADPPRDWARPPTLRGGAVEIRPCRPGPDAPLLHRLADPELLRYMPSQRAGSPTDLEASLRRLVDDPATLLFTVALAATGEPVGVTSYLDIRPAHRGLEIGHTWISQPHQGTRVNPEMKLLLLAHAFDALGCVRVQLKTDARNLRSRRAIEKLGATREGTLRRHMVLPDGFVRDTVMYSITDEDWPRVREGLLGRLRSP